MHVDLLIPEKTVKQKVTEIRLKPGNKEALVIVSAEGKTTSYVVDFQPVLDLGSATQKNNVRVFFKRIAAIGLDQHNEAIGQDVVEGDVVDEIFDDV